MELREVITFAGGLHDRAGHRRRDDAWLAEARLAARLLQVRAPSALAFGEGCAPDEAVFLGVDAEGRAIFACECSEEGDGFEELRALAATIPGSDAAIAAHAVAMVMWHRRHRFCGACGTPTDVQEAGHSRKCPNCGLHHFPRTDPAVIMLVTDGERAVLGRRPGAVGRWSVLAGFVEPGETLEQAVAREVKEEVGLNVTHARYLASQPWPFPANLMLGFEARAEYGPIVLDDELEEARWFTRAELRENLASRGMDVPAPISIASHLIQAWLAESD